MEVYCLAIKLEIEFDLFFHKSELEEINEELKGIYILMDCNEEPLYIGETKNIKSRLNSHVKGVSNTSSFHERIENIKVIIEDDFLKRKLIERFNRGYARHS